MKPLQTSLQRLMKDDKNFKHRHETMKMQILQHPPIVAFLQENQQITEATIEKRLNRLYEYMTQSINCDRCKDYHSCKNIVQGYTPKLQYINDDIHLSYEKCSNLLHYEKTVAKQRLIKSLYMPREILQAKMNNLFIDPSRAEAVKVIDEFIETAHHRLPKRGIFFSGPFGVGKTYFLGAIANELQSL